MVLTLKYFKKKLKGLKHAIYTLLTNYTDNKKGDYFRLFH